MSDTPGPAEWPPPGPPPGQPVWTDPWQQDMSAWAPVGSGPPVPEGREGMSVAGLVLGILPVFGGLLGIVFGLVGRSRARKSGRKGAVMGAWGAGLGFVWLLGLIAAAVLGVLNEPSRAATGGFAERGKILWSDLEVGDCLERDPGDGVALVTVTPCVSPHEVEVFDTFSSTSDDIRVSRAYCLRGLSTYVGAPSDAAPNYEVNVLQSEAGAEGGPAVCLLLAPQKASLVRAVRASWPWQPAVPTPKPSGAGALTGDISLDDLRARDCISRMPKGAVTTMPVVPCRSRHAGEVYDVHALGTGAYPGDRQVDRLALGRCRKTLPTFVGARQGSTGYAIRYYAPTRDSWSRGDTTVICILTDPGGRLLVGDAKGAGRNRS